MSLFIDRRTFLAAPFFVRNLISAPPSDQFRLGAFGAGGMAYDTFDGSAPSQGQADLRRRSGFGASSSSKSSVARSARVYQDWREMLDKEHRNLDVVCVGTPDHMHAPIAMSAMRQGLHVYAQKPLTHDIYEVRMLTAVARKKNLVTQMGIQIHSAREYRTAVAADPGRRHRQGQGSPHLEREEVGRSRPAARAHRPGPATLNWDCWLGVAQPRPFIGDVLSPGELAQAARLRHRHLRRHGLPHPRPGLQRAGA